MARAVITTTSATASHTVARTVDERTNETRYRYDGNGNLVERRNPLASCAALPGETDITT